jgi:hypothetical protein
VDRHGADGVDGGEPGRAELQQLAAALEDRREAVRRGGDDDAGVAVVEAQAVVVLGHEQGPAEVTGPQLSVHPL